MLAHRLVAPNLFCSASRDDLPVHQDVVAIGDVQRRVHVVVGDEDPDARVAQPVDDVLKLLNRHGVDAGEGFVEEDEIGFRGKRPGDFDAPSLTARKHATGALHDPADMELFAQSVDDLVLLRPADSSLLQHQADVVFHGETAKNAALLSQVSDPGARALMHGPLRDLLAIEFHDSALRLHQAGDHVERGRFPRTVRPEKPDNLALGEFDADIIHHAATPVFLDEIGRGDCERCAHPPSSFFSISTLLGLPFEPYFTTSMRSLNWM